LRIEISITGCIASYIVNITVDVYVYIVGHGMSSSRGSRDEARDEGNLLLFVEAANILEGKRTSSSGKNKIIITCEVAARHLKQPVS